MFQLSYLYFGEKRYYKKTMYFDEKFITEQLNRKIKVLFITKGYVSSYEAPLHKK